MLSILPASIPAVADPDPSILIGSSFFEEKEFNLDPDFLWLGSEIGFFVIKGWIRIRIKFALEWIPYPVNHNQHSKIWF